MSDSFALLGIVTSTMIFLSPLQSVQQTVHHTKSLKSHNPLPYCMIVCNCLAWLLYSFLVRNYYIFFGNLIGWCLGLYYVLSMFAVALNSSGPQSSECFSMLAVLVSGTALSFLGALFSFIVNFPGSGESFPSGHQVDIMGYTAIIILTLFYASPLAALAQVVRTKNSALFQWGMSTTCLANGLLWTTYGLKISDIFVWLPNLVGCLMAVIQLGCKVVYPEQTSFSRVSGI